MIEPNYTPEQIERLWHYRNSVITIFNNFVNSFVVAESVLLAVVGILASSSSPMTGIKIPVIFLGLFLTLLWMYVQANQRFILQSLKGVCAEHLPEYRKQLKLRQNSVWKFSTTWLLAFLLPLVFAAIWVIVLYAVL